MTVNFSKKSFLTKRRGNRKPGRAYGFPSPARAPLWPTAAAGSLCSARMGLRDPGQQRWWGWRWEPWRGLREVGGAWGGAWGGPDQRQPGRAVREELPSWVASGFHFEEA